MKKINLCAMYIKQTNAYLIAQTVTVGACE